MDPSFSKAVGAIDRRRGCVVKHVSNVCLLLLSRILFFFLISKFNKAKVRGAREFVDYHSFIVQGRCIIFPERKVVDARFKTVDVNYDNRVLRMRISTSGLFECRFTSVLLSLARIAQRCRYTRMRIDRTRKRDFKHRCLARIFYLSYVFTFFAYIYIYIQYYTRLFKPPSFLFPFDLL